MKSRGSDNSTYRYLFNLLTRNNINKNLIIDKLGLIKNIIFCGIIFYIDIPDPELRAFQAF